ncbi:hypothetical protein PO909_000612 [Leuciscus waleckii]
MCSTKSWSLKLQEDGLTLPEAPYAFETAVLRLTAMEIEAGNVKQTLLCSVIARLQSRFKGVETHQVPAKLVDPREWVADHQELACYGRDHLTTVCDHFANVLDRIGCDRDKAQHVEWPAAKVLIKSLSQSLQRNAWQDFFLDNEQRSSFPNLLLIVELILVLPLSTATVERDFSAMKR